MQHLKVLGENDLVRLKVMLCKVVFEGVQFVLYWLGWRPTLEGMEKRNIQPAFQLLYLKNDQNGAERRELGVQIGTSLRLIARSCFLALRTRTRRQGRPTNQTVG